MKKLTLAVAAIALAAVAALATGALSSSAGAASPTAAPHSMQSMNLQSPTRSDLRSLLGRQLGEHAALAMNATNLGVTGSPAFPAAAAALDRSSVALSKSIASVYGKKAGNTFLNGKFQWRAHIGFFVDYTVATAKKDKAGQSKAVANLQRYTAEHAKFLGGATGVAVKALQNDLTAHILQLKGQLDAYAAKKYERAATLYQAAYAHMFMTGDVLANAIADQKKLAK